MGGTVPERAERHLAWISRALVALVLLSYALAPWATSRSSDVTLLGELRAVGSSVLESIGARGAVVPTTAADLYVLEIVHLAVLVPVAAFTLLLAPRRRAPRLAFAAAALALGLAVSVLGRSTSSAFVLEGNVWEPSDYRVAFEAFALLPLAISGIVAVRSWSARRAAGNGAFVALVAMSLAAVTFPVAREGQTALIPLRWFDLESEATRGSVGLDPLWGARVLVLLLLALVWVEHGRLALDPTLTRLRLEQGPSPAPDPWRGVRVVSRWRYVLATAGLVLVAGVGVFTLRCRSQLGTLARERERIGEDLRRAVARVADAPTPMLWDGGLPDDASSATLYAGLPHELGGDRDLELSQAAQSEPVPVPEAVKEPDARTRCLLARRKVLAKYATVLETVSAVPACPTCRWSANEPLLGNLANLLVADGLEREAHGDVHGAARSYLASCRVAADLLHERDLHERRAFMTLRLWSHALARLGALICHGERGLVAKELPTIERALEPLRAALPSREDVARAERLKEENALSAPAPGSESGGLPYLRQALRRCSRLELAARYGRDFECVVASPSRASRDAAQKRLDDVGASDPSVERKIAYHARWLRDALDELVARFAVTRVAIELEGTRRDGGGYRVPGALPGDPYAPSSPVQVRLTPTGYDVFCWGGRPQVSLTR